MKNILVWFVFILSRLTCFAQDYGYYLTRGGGEKMPLNSLIDYTLDRHTPLYSDSVYLGGTYYKITGRFYVDTFPFDQMDYYQASITVEGLGTIYSMNEHSRSCWEQFTLLLAVSDPKKQKVLQLAYLRLSRTDRWFDWKRCAELVSLYDYKTCEKSLSDLWMKNRKDLGLIESKALYDGNKVTFSGKIVNRSKGTYFFGEGTHFGPVVSAQTIDGRHVADSLKSPWSYSVGQLKKDIVLLPGDTMVVSEQFLRKNDQVIYEGFQFYSSQTLLQLLFSNSLTCRMTAEEKDKLHWRYGVVPKVEE